MVELVAALPADEPGSVLFVGRSGELYRPIAEDHWGRRRGGGVAVKVASAIAEPGGRIFLVGDRTPIFEGTDGHFHVHALPNRGPTAAAAGAPVLAVGRHIYRLEKGRWQRIGSVDATVTALLADDRHLYAATSRGEIRRRQGRGWASLALPLAAGDGIAHLVAGVGGRVLALSAGGALFEVSGNRARSIARPAELADLTVHAMGADRDGRIFIAGVTERDERRIPLLCEVVEAGLREVEELWPLAEGDAFALLLGLPDGLLLATRRGEVAFRYSQEQEKGWRRGRVEAGLPAVRPDGRDKRFEGVGPAPAR